MDVASTNAQYAADALVRTVLTLVLDTDHRFVGEIVRREKRWTSAGETPARELVRSTR
jgi:hypothetical protein